MTIITNANPDEHRTYCKPCYWYRLAIFSDGNRHTCVRNVEPVNGVCKLFEREPVADDE